MTRSEYDRLYSQARRRYPLIQKQTLDELKKIYVAAADDVASIIQDVTTRNLSILTSSSWEEIRRSLLFGADSISQYSETAIPELVTNCYFLTERRPGMARIDSQFLKDAVSRAGAGGLITPEGLDNIPVGVNQRLIVSLLGRQWQDGYYFEERVWGGLRYSDKLKREIAIGLNGEYQLNIRNIIDAGLAQGRDAVEIARDIEAYARKGREFVFSPGRYGKLLAGTAEYAKRIRKTIDFRALRLVRSELYASMQEASIWQGQINPACEPKLYDWIKNRGNPIDPDGSRNASGKRCIDLERDGPYTLENVPGYQHPNCSCQIRSRLMPVDQFVHDLSNWLTGESVPYIETWYRNVYLASQG